MNPTNGDIAGVLDRIADLLETQGANVHRVRSYRNGARTVRDGAEPVAEIVRSGDGKALEALPGIGERLSRLIVEYVETGRVQLLNRLEGEVAPEDVFTRVPGIGKELAERIASTLGIHTLEALEEAAHDGRLAKVEGFGPRRVEAVKSTLAGMLSRSARRRSRELEAGDWREAEAPDVAMLLDVDAEYREKADAGRLRKIAPKRFNPKGEAWLPVLHTERDDWHFTALYSNTARAHDLGKIHDWVVIYFDRNGSQSQVTVVTETSGPLEGKRVVRGREVACRKYYAGEAKGR